MAKKIPEINDLIAGINDTDLSMSESKQEEQPVEQIEALQPQPETEQTEIEDAVVLEVEKDFKSDEVHSSDTACWNSFLTLLERVDDTPDKDQRLICKLDRDLADSLDECNINNHSRTDLVNAIVRAFLGCYLGQLRPFRRERKSLFDYYKDVQP
jgi:hypothetical protein bacD2_21857